MPDLSQYSNEELMQIANIQNQPKDLSSYSDDELNKIAKTSSFLPKLGETEQKIAQRPNDIQTFKEEWNNNPKNIVEALSNPLRPAVLGMKAFNIPFSRGESAVASTGLALQRGEPQNIAGDVASSLMGKRQAQVGDIIRTTGFGGKLNEPLASTTGLLGLMGIGNLVTKGSVAPNITKNISSDGIIGGLGKTGTQAQQEIVNIVSPIKKTVKNIGEKFNNYKNSVVEREQLPKTIENLQQQQKASEIKLETLGEQQKVDLENKDLDIKNKVKEIDTAKENKLSELKALQDKMAKATARSIQQRTPQIKGQMNTEYGDKLQALQDQATQTGNQVTRGDIDTAIRKTELDTNLQDNKTKEFLKKWKKDNGVGLGQLSDEERVQELVGEGIPRQAAEKQVADKSFDIIYKGGKNPSEAIDLKYLDKRLSDLGDTISANDRTTARVKAIFDKHLQDTIGNKIPGYMDLRKGYSPIVEQKEFLEKNFPQSGGYTEGEKVVNNVVTGKAGAGDIEKMADINQRTGGVINPLQELVNKQKRTENYFETTKNKTQQSLAEMLRNSQASYAQQANIQEQNATTIAEQLAKAIKLQKEVGNVKTLGETAKQVANPLYLARRIFSHLILSAK